MVDKKEDLAYYLSLPYTEILGPDDEGGFVARIEELRGCIAHGDTKEKALKSLAVMRDLWIKDAFENDEPIPEPALETRLGE